MRRSGIFDLNCNVSVLISICFIGWAISWYGSIIATFYVEPDSAIASRQSYGDYNITQYGRMWDAVHKDRYYGQRTIAVLKSTSTFEAKVSFVLLFIGYLLLAANPSIRSSRIDSRIDIGHECGVWNSECNEIFFTHLLIFILFWYCFVLLNYWSSDLDIVS